MHAFPLVFGLTNSMVWGSARQSSWRQHRGSQAAREVCQQDGCAPRPLQSALLGGPHLPLPVSWKGTCSSFRKKVSRGPLEGSFCNGQRMGSAWTAHG